MLCEQDQRAVEAMVRCEIELEELCVIFPNFKSSDIGMVMEKVANEKIGVIKGMHSVC